MLRRQEAALGQHLLEADTAESYRPGGSSLHLISRGCPGVRPRQPSQ